jgi:FimV-like protein
MPRKPFRYWLISLLLAPACALALEIGEIQVNSSLNQLFDARIPLPKLTPEELTKVSVKLAPPPMFKEFGLDRASTLANLVFSIEYNAEGEVYVKVVSTQPIREPSLGLLLEFGWPRGKTFREFTIFLDPVQRLAKQRPSDRTKTVLDASAAAASEPAPAAPVPIPAAVTAAVSESAAAVPAPVSTPALAPAAIAVPEIAQSPPVPPLLPVEAPPAPPAPPVKAYKSGDSYGPVAAGESLWKIALKVRPDSDITPDQMMQALFRANPNAFAKSGIDGLKVGSTLRIPTLREIADFTGSVAARRLADAEQAAISSLADSARPQTEPSAAKPMVDAAQISAEGPKTFPLAPPVGLEPMAVIAMPHVPVLESVNLAPEPAQVESKLDHPASEPAVAAIEPKVGEVADRLPISPVAESLKMAAGPMVMPKPTKPPLSGFVARPVGVAPAVAPPLLEPVSATPLVFLAVSEVMASVVRIPAFAIPAQIVPGSIIADVPAPPPARKIPEIGAIPPAVTAGRVVEPPNSASQTPNPDAAMNLGKASPASGEVADLLTVLEERVRSAELDLTPFSPGAKPSITPPPAAEAASTIPLETLPLPITATVGEAEAPPAEMVAPPVVETPPAEMVAPPVVETPPAEMAAPPVVETPPAEIVVPSAVEIATLSATDPAKLTAEPIRYKSDDQYGPVASNERLWDIAAKVRPDPSIGKDVMMRALFMANPQAFSKLGINQMKVGAMLRVPTLREIVDYTGSGAAKLLLEQQTKSNIPPALESVANPEPAPVSASDPAPVVEPGVSAEAESESESKSALESTRPVAEMPLSNVTPPAN